MGVAKKPKVLEIPPEELDRLLCNFRLIAKKTDHSKYETSLSRSIQRFLDENNSKVNILTNNYFLKFTKFAPVTCTSRLNTNELVVIVVTRGQFVTVFKHRLKHVNV